MNFYNEDLSVNEKFNFIIQPRGYGRTVYKIRKITGKDSEQAQEFSNVIYGVINRRKDMKYLVRKEFACGIGWKEVFDYYDDRNICFNESNLAMHDRTLMRIQIYQLIDPETWRDKNDQSD